MKTKKSYITLTIQNAAGVTLAEKRGDFSTSTTASGTALAAAASPGYLNLFYTGEYAEGDTITLSASAPSYLVLQLDDVLEPALVYLSGQSYRFSIPFAEKRLSYNPKAFSGDSHLLQARFATEAEVTGYRNLAQNSHDSASATSCFPHAWANIETRGEAVFAARNAIDGNTENSSHGAWPFASWGINRDPKAELHLDFGRRVTVDTIVLVTRADFPHDSWWEEATITFSDGDSMLLKLTKTALPQAFTFSPRQISSLTLHSLIKTQTDDSPFPALSQIEVYGKDSLS